MVNRKKSADEPSHNPKPEDDLDAACRPTFYMTTELLSAIEQQSGAEDKKRSPFVAELLEFLLTSPTGEQLRDFAQTHRRSLVDELEHQLILFNEQIPTEKIAQLAAASQRNPDQMLIRLVLLGLRVYERGIARMEAEIEGRSELP
jgi:hypothetical protein